MVVMVRKLRSLLLLAGMILLGLPLTAQSGTPLPEVPEATQRFSATQGCVEPTAEIRKNHMKMMLHKRDQTVHEGVRTPQHSLEECINCHVPDDDSGKIVRIDSKEHFCNSCHSYAGVSIDCFQCHADRPVKKTEFHPLVAKPSSHHAQAISNRPISDGPNSNGPVSTGTLEVLAEEGKLQ